MKGVQGLPLVGKQVGLQPAQLAQAEVHGQGGAGFEEGLHLVDLVLHVGHGGGNAVVVGDGGRGSYGRRESCGRCFAHENIPFEGEQGHHERRRGAVERQEMRGGYSRRSTSQPAMVMQEGTTLPMRRSAAD